MYNSIIYLFFEVVFFKKKLIADMLINEVYLKPEPQILWKSLKPAL